MPTIKTKFEISGEKEYRKALGDINEGMRVLNSEMQLTESQFGKNAKSVEALGAKNDVLSRKISTQKDKIEVLKKALQESAEKYGESDKRTMKWQTSLNKAEAELNNMNNELEENNKLMKQGEGSTRGLGDAVQGLASKFGITLPDSMTKSMNSMVSLDVEALALIGGFAAVAAAIAKVEEALIGLTKQSAKYADEINTLAAQTNLSTQTLQEMRYSAELLDVSVDTIRSSLVKLTNNMQTAQSGTGAAAEAFKTLGVDVQDADGNLRNAETVFYELVDALGAVENSTERDALAMDIFGRSATDLNPLIKAGSETMRELATEANATGYVLDDLALKKLQAVDDAMQRMQKQTEASKNELAVEFAPYMEEALKEITTLIKDLGEALVKSGAVEAFGMILESVVGIITPVNDLSNNGLPSLEQALMPVAKLLAGVADTINFIVSAIGFLSTPVWNWDAKMTYGYKALQSFGFYPNSNPNNTQKIANRQNQLEAEAARQTALSSGNIGYGLTAYSSNGGARPFNAAGTQNWQGGLTMVGEQGKELVSLPQGSRIYTASETRTRSLGDTIYNITISAADVKEFNDIIRLAENARRYERMGVT